MTNIDSLQYLDDHSPHPFGLSLTWEAVVLVTGREDLGAGPSGHRFIVPITGGAFRGGPEHPDLQGKVLPGGADRQILRPDGVKELRAIYEMRVNDGTVIQLDNQVIVDTERQPERYAASRIHVSAPAGRWSWMNRRVFVGTLQSNQPNTGYVVIRGWELTC